ncbi:MULTISPECIES: carbonic anhydrase [unclassified Oceanobacter]|uniref:carbonic anhydrase n=1 Tax=unclassified Oceanobacter TaxID=2620260 RepID=UPI002733ECAA|nr:MULTISPECIES: carbonic anhydrase family protein [unclassified Oceanobacter]MDP2607473.1 carbonic anhydrase family protein [Oceanobacter sp. 1_MG-2023]MDP2610741.1 carbonic anhydrase family protein [Oceanobacter sp. 2_MG-2023]
MIKQSALILIGALTLNSLIASADPSHSWSYEGANGPEHWSSLSDNNTACNHGWNQSPLNLTAMIDADQLPLVLNYHPGGKEILNNGHTVQVNYATGNTLNVGYHRFNLMQLHFHTPSENRIESRSYPMEMHMVHATPEGRLAVLAIMFKTGKKNAELARIWDDLPQPGQRRALKGSLDITQLLPSSLDYIRYNGSLTTPPCTEGVSWFVLKTPIEASADQMTRFTRLIGENNRPLQHLNARMIIK